jgi:hypothetical protein
VRTHLFARFRCAACGTDHLVAFSCKGRTQDRLCFAYPPMSWGAIQQENSRNSSSAHS